MYEVFEHTADLGLRIRAGSLEELFCEAAVGLFSLIVTNLGDVRPQMQLDFALPSRDQDNEYLLFDWLNELLFTFETRYLLMVKFEVQFSTSGLQAKAWGELADSNRHQLDHEVKAITYHGLKVVQEPGGWLAEVIVDI